MPKVSICIPAFNQIVYLKNTLDSILSQTFLDYEVILTDDSPGSIVKELIDQYDFNGKLHYLRNELPLGTPENWNECIKKATGEYIKIIHHDDWFSDNDSLARYVALLDDNPEANFAFSASNVVFTDKNWVHALNEEQVLLLKNNPLVLLSANIIGSPSATIYRNSQLLLFDSNIKWLVDIEYYLRLLENNTKFAYCPQPLIITFCAEGRVSDECINNINLQIFEYFYVLNSLNALSYKYNSKQLNFAINQAIKFCIVNNITSVSHIAACGCDTVHPNVRFYLFLTNVSPVLGRCYFKIKRSLGH